MATRRRHLAVGDPTAVEILDGKIHGKVRDEITWRRLLRGAATARRRHRQVRDGVDMGFYHGLLTGYAVALKAPEGKVRKDPPSALARSSLSAAHLPG